MSLRLYRRPGSDNWYVRGTVRGRRIFETTETEDKKLAEIYRAKRETELYERAVLGAADPISFAAAALSYLEDGEDERSPRTRLLVIRLADHFAGRNCDQIDQAAADAAVKALCKPDAAPATKNRTVYTPLRAVLTHASWKWPKSCPAPRIRGKTEELPPPAWLKPAQAIRLMNAAAPHLRPLLHFFLCTGARVSEALDLDWSDVDLPAAKVVLRDTKNGTDRPARLPPAIVVTLANLPHRDGRVFRRDDGAPYADKERQEGGQIKTAFRAACRRSGLIVWEPAQGAPPPEAEDLCTPVRWAPVVTPHDLRHTWASWFYALSKDMLLLKDEGGWASTAMVERYAHLMPSDLVGEIRSVWGSSHPRIGALPGIGANVVQLVAAPGKSK